MDMLTQNMDCIKILKVLKKIYKKIKIDILKLFFLKKI